MNVTPDNFQRSRLFSDARSEQRWSMQSVIDVVARRGRWIVLTVLICLALSGYYLATTPDSFTATAVLMTDTKQTPPLPSQLSQEPLIDPAVIDSQIEILKSERIAQQVVDDLHLASDPAFASGGPGPRARFVAWATGQASSEPTAQARRMGAVDSLLHKVKIVRAGHSYLAEIAATTFDPVLSARIANAVAEAYIKDQLDSRLSANQRTVSWMAHRVDDVKQQATAAADIAARYGQDHAIALAARDGATLANAQDLATAADAAKTDFEALQNRSLRLAQFIQQQTLPITEARVLTSAEPPLFKSAPKSGVIVLVAILGGVLIGSGIVVVRETLDRKLRSSRQIKGMLGLCLAGAVPAVRVAGGDGLATLFDARRPWCTATETFRSLKVSIDSDVRRAGGVVVGVVSPWPGEGKTTLTMNLGRMLVEVGARVLVIDGDLKKPDLSCAFGSASGPGLVDLIDGGATLDECRIETRDGFGLVGHGRGRVPLHPFDALGSRRMQSALAAAQSSYDYVLVDLPALLTSMDSQAMARSVDVFVLVAEYGRTTIDDVDRALATSEMISNRVVGVVLNKARGPRSVAQRRMTARVRGRNAAVNT